MFTECFVLRKHTLVVVVVVVGIMKYKLNEHDKTPIRTHRQYLMDIIYSIHSRCV